MSVATPLLICADDFGYSPAVDAGIAQLIDAGRVTATSCLAGSPRWAEAATLARRLRQRADVGLHLDLTEFRRLASLPRLLLAARFGLLDRSRILQTIREQLDLFENAVGAAPDYVDGHQHVHQLPPVATALLEELQRRYAQHSPWVRLSQPPGTDLKSRIIAAQGATRFARELARTGLRHTRRLLGVYDFRADPPYVQRLATWLGTARAGDALMVHPADGVTAGDPLGEARLREFTTLLADSGALLDAAGVVPARGVSLADPAVA